MTWNPYALLASILAFLQQVNWKLDVIQAQLTKGQNMATALDTQIAEIQKSVTSLTTTVGSATALISGFSAQLGAAISAAQAAGATPAELQSLTDLKTSIDANTTSLAAAVAANATPVAATPAKP